MKYNLKDENRIHCEILKSIDNLDILSNLVLTSFNKFIASDYSKIGQDTFYSFFDKGTMLLKTIENNDFVIIAKDKEKTVGLISTRAKSHISLLFVDENYHGKGIARKLLNTLLINIDTDTLTVNSSPFAEKIYEKLGFTITGQMTEKDGIKSIPMNFVKRGQL